MQIGFGFRCKGCSNDRLSRWENAGTFKISRIILMSVIVRFNLQEALGLLIILGEGENFSLIYRKKGIKGKKLVSTFRII